jgi:hypothetical protein
MTCAAWSARSPTLAALLRRPGAARAPQPPAANPAASRAEKPTDALPQGATVGMASVLPVYSGVVVGRDSCRAVSVGSLSQLEWNLAGWIMSINPEDGRPFWHVATKNTTKDNRCAYVVLVWRRRL